MSNYSATVVKIKELRPHSNADRLVCTNIFGNNVIVGKETQVGDVGLFFPLESQIGVEFAQANDLIRRKDENGKPAGGMFDENRRVRAQTFRGEKSMGFFIPINSLDLLSKALPFVIDSNDYKEGQELESIEGVVISQKYVPRTNQTNGLGGKAKKARQPRVSRIVPGQFHFHTDTAQLGKNIHKINPEDVIVLTWKLHGTSAIASRCLTNIKMGFFSKLLSKLGVKIEKSQYDMIYASRRVIKNEFEESKQHYYDHDLWTEIGKQHFEGKLHTGETVYYEIVGFTKNGSYIQKGFDYGCDPYGLDEYKPQHKVFLYRITQTAVDGTVIELQWNQVKERAKELNVPTVPVIFYGEAKQLVANNGVLIDLSQFPKESAESILDSLKTYGISFVNSNVFKMEADWAEGLLAYLKMRYVYDQDCQFCTNKVPAEGIVLRKEGLTIEAFKLKSFRFLEYETKELDKGEQNIEDDGTSI